MKIEKVVEEFLKLLSQGKVDQAEKLIMEEAKGREDDVAGYLMGVGIVGWDRGYHSMTFYFLETAGKIAKSEDLMEIIIQNLAIVHSNYGVLLEESCLESKCGTRFFCAIFTFDFSYILVSSFF